MSKSLKEAPLTTASARAKLSPGVHWRGIDPSVHLGYRRGVRGGRWLVRWRRPGGAYTQEPVATADDILAADGMQTLSYSQAIARARQTVEQRRAEAAAAKAGPPVTVRMAIEAYLTERGRREDVAGARKHDARSRLTKHVLGDERLHKTALFALTEQHLKDWRGRLKAHAGLSPATIQRLTNDLKAALNTAARDHRSVLPPDIGGIIKIGLSRPKGEKRGPAARGAQVILPDADIRRIIAAAQSIDEAGEWQGDLMRMVVVLAATGARFSQVARLTVADVQTRSNRLMMPVSRKGNGEKPRTHEPVPVGEDVLVALRPAMSGRKAGEVLLLRPRWKQTSPTVWEITGRRPWLSAAELTRPWSEIIKTAKLPTATVPYALRHSSIVRALKAGIPNRMVAAMHDTSTQMIERHYSVHLLDALDLIAARAVVPLMPDDGANIVPLRA